MKMFTTGCLRCKGLGVLPDGVLELGPDGGIDGEAVITVGMLVSRKVEQAAITEAR